MKLVDATFAGLGIECKIWDDSITILAWLDSLQIINPFNKNEILRAEKVHYGLILRPFYHSFMSSLFLKLIPILG